VNIPHALAEQASHLAHILGEVRDRGFDIVETSQAAEDSWQDEIARTAVMARDFYEECTPGYYNNEGRVTDGTGYAAGMYGGGPVRFFSLLADWRAAGDLPGLELRRAH
jgi:hypothetical protein